MHLEVHENGIQWIETTISGTRKKKGYAIRRSRAELVQRLTNIQFDALHEIERAYHDLEQGFGCALLGIKPPSFTRIKSDSPTEISEETIDQIRERLGKLHRWEFYMADKGLKHYRDVICSICSGDTASSYSDRHNGKPAKSTVIIWFARGLDEYCKLQGWA